MDGKEVTPRNKAATTTAVSRITTIITTTNTAANANANANAVAANAAATIAVPLPACPLPKPQSRRRSTYHHHRRQCRRRQCRRRHHHRRTATRPTQIDLHIDLGEVVHSGERLVANIEDPDRPNDGLDGGADGAVVSPWHAEQRQMREAAAERKVSANVNRAWVRVTYVCQYISSIQVYPGSRTRTTYYYVLLRMIL